MSMLHDVREALHLIDVAVAPLIGRSIPPKPHTPSVLAIFELTAGARHLRVALKLLKEAEEAKQ